MKLSVPFAATILLLLSTLAPASSHDHQEPNLSMIYEVKEAMVAFETGFPDKYTQEQENFIVTSIKEAYDEIHDKKVSIMPKVVMESESRTEISSDVVGHEWFSMMTVGMCDSCKPQDCDDDDGCGKLEDEDSHENWELALCNKLQNGPFEELNSAKKCTIDYVERGLHIVRSRFGVEEEIPEDFIVETWDVSYSISVKENRPYSTAEENFIANAVLNAYNMIHDPSKYVALDLRVQSEENASVLAAVSNNRTQTRTEPTTTATDGQLGDFSVNWRWLSAVQSGRCGMCDKDNCDRPRCRKRKMESRMVGGRPYWEATWCSLLRNGPFEIFSHVTDCTIHILHRLETVAGGMSVGEDNEDEEHDEVEEEENGEEDDGEAQTEIQVETAAMKSVKRAAKISFEIHNDQDFSEFETVFIGNCVIGAFNEMNDPSKTLIESLQIERQEAHEVPSIVVVGGGGEEQDGEKSKLRGSSHSSSSSLLSTFSFTREMWGVVKLEVCRFCDRAGLAEIEALDATDTVAWATSLCNKLRRGPFDILSRAEGCRISIQDMMMQQE